MSSCPVPTVAWVFLIVSAAGLWGCSGPEGETVVVEAASVAWSGVFAGRENQATHGGFRIVADVDHWHLELTDDFQTDPGPDLHVVLSPVPPEQATGNNAMADGNAVIVGKLQSLAGPQTYDVPPGVDPAEFQSVLIQCVKYSHLYGAAELK